MKRLFSIAAALLLMSALLLPMTDTAHAEEYDHIVSYELTVEPQTADGSLLITVAFDWQAVEELPYGQELKIGIPNGSVREVTPLSDNIEDLAYDNSYMYVYLDRTYEQGEVFHFSYSWVQEYMYTLSDDGAVSYVYTPGWFDEISVDRMVLRWYDPAEADASIRYTADQPDCWQTGNENELIGTDLPYGATVTLTADYSQWPTELSWDNSSENLPEDQYSDPYWEDDDEDGDALFGFIILVIVIVFILWILPRVAGDGYAGGFGTHYVFVNNLWYPMGPDGKPRPGSVGTPHRPAPPRSGGSGRGGGFGGGSRGGGFGGGGFGGGGHCACASSCACACACACAGGGRAGCSAKNLYGAVKLDETVAQQLSGK